MRARARRVLALACVASLSATCSGSDAPADLQQGAEVIAQMLAPRHLRRSMFLAVHREGRPSQLVDYLFSTRGSAEWPDPEAAGAADPMLAEQARAIGMSLLPAGVAFTAGSPKSDLGRQIVVRSDDARNAVIVEGYVDPSEPPVLRVEYVLVLPELSPRERELLERFAAETADLGG